MTSRFFQVSSGEESSDDDTPELGNTAVTRFDNFSDSDSDGDVKRVVKSAKDKRFEELQVLTEKITTLKKINDWGLIATTFDQMFKVYEKAKLHLGADAAQAPRFFVKCYAELDSFNKQILEQKKEGTLTINKTNSKALTAMKQKLRKTMATFKLEEAIAAYNENPDKDVVKEDSSDDDNKDSDSDDDDSDDDSDDDDDEGGGFARFLQKKKETVSTKQAEVTAKKDTLKDDDDDMSDDWSDDDDSDLSDLEEVADGEITAAFFLKKEPTESKKKTKEGNKAPRTKAEGKDNKPKAKEEKKEYELFPKDTEITLELVMEKLVEILSMRGRKGVSRLDMEKNLYLLRECAAKEELGLGIDVRIHSSILLGTFDQVPHHAAHMPREVWEKCVARLEELLAMMEEHDGTDGKSKICVSDDYLDDMESITEIPEGAEEGTPKNPLKVRGSLVFFIERLDDELTKTLQAIDPHTSEYI